MGRSMFRFGAFRSVSVSSSLAFLLGCLMRMAFCVTTTPEKASFYVCALHF